MARAWPYVIHPRPSVLRFFFVLIVFFLRSAIVLSFHYGPLLIFPLLFIITKPIRKPDAHPFSIVREGGYIAPTVVYRSCSCTPTFLNRSFSSIVMWKLIADIYNIFRFASIDKDFNLDKNWLKYCLIGLRINISCSWTLGKWTLLATRRIFKNKKGLIKYEM